jgi:hypothetical protein
MPNPTAGINIKRTQKGRWVTADLHIHSIYSDGGFTPAEILKYGASHFIDAVAIADHSEIKGAMEAKALAENHPELPVTLSAQEVSAGNRFHFLLINSYRSYSEFTRDNIMDRLEEHRQLGGLTVVAHPWTIPNSKWARSCLRDLIVADLVDGIELFNSAALEISGIRNIWEGIWEEWIGPYKLGVFGGSDFHHLHKGRYIGNGRTYLKVYLPGEQGIIDALRARRCVAGLFGNRTNRGDSIEVGLLWGQEPWSTDLQRFRENLHKRLITGLSRYSPAYRRLFLNLFELGNYQLLSDLL